MTTRRDEERALSEDELAHLDVPIRGWFDGIRCVPYDSDASGFGTGMGYPGVLITLALRVVGPRTIHSLCPSASATVDRMDQG